MSQVLTEDVLLQKEGMELLMQRKVRGDRLLEKWARNSVGKDFGILYDTNPNKARFGAAMLEAQERHLKQLYRLAETAVSSSYQTTPENVLKIVKLGVANAIRGDLFTEVALVTPDDAIYYLERKLETTFTGRGTAGQIINENINPLYPSEQLYISTVGTTGTQYTLTAANIPIRANKVVITLDGKYLGYDDGAGTIVPAAPYSGVGLLTTGITATYQAVDYTTGVCKLEFDAAVPATSTIAMWYSWDSEQSTLYGQYGKVILTTRKDRFRARPEPLGYSYTQMSEVLLGTTMGINADAELVEAVGLEHALAKDYRAITRAIQIANSQKTFTYNADFAAYGEVSENAHAQNILTKIDLIGGEVFNDKKRGMINKAVVGTKMLSYLRKHKIWKENESAVREGPYKAGGLGGIDVYCCPSDTTVGMTENDAVLMYKNPREGLDIGLAIGVLTELAAKLVYPQMYVEGNVASVESMLVLNRSFVRKLTLQNFNIVA